MGSYLVLDKKVYDAKPTVNFFMFGLFGLFLCFLIIQAGETGGRILPFVGSTELSSEFIARGARPASGPPLSQGKELARAGPQEIELSPKNILISTRLPRGDGPQEKRAFSHFLFLLSPRVGGAGAGSQEIELSQKVFTNAM